jgi:hypothetical protein
MALTADIRGYATVQSWIDGLREQWGEEPGDLDKRLEVLERFCRFMDKDPDTLIEDCSRVVESGKRIKIKVRRQYTEKIAEFQGSADGDARAQARAGNIVRSFFIHNGIFMQAGLQG